jgi:hypothetical protein
MNEEKIQEAFELLRRYVEKENYAGWDPFDGLNSRFFQSIPLLKKHKWSRLIWLQFFKHSPINFRKLTGVPKQQNPKALALFLNAYLRLYETNPSSEIKDKTDYLAKRLIETATRYTHGTGWGYNFDWQARAFFLPAYTPTSVATSFATEALAYYHKLFPSKKTEKIFEEIESFVLKDLNRTSDKDGDFIFSYSPLDRTQVFNAGLLAAKTLIITSAFTGNQNIRNEAKKVFRFVAKQQNPDGSWFYGTLPHHRWIDNFHTGYNLEAYSVYKELTKDISFDQIFEKGLSYYLSRFWLRDGTPKYYDGKIYPVDLHSTAQLIVTLKKSKRFEENKDLAFRVLQWTLEHMQSPKGYFYYQKKLWYINKIPYMRWTQAWMFYALSFIPGK